MKARYRVFLLAGGMIGLAAPAYAQPKNLLTDLSQQPASTPVQSHQPFLAAAHDDVEGHRWGAAETQLEQCEILLLNGGVKASNGVVTSPSLAMGYVIQARAAVHQRDQVDALLAIDKAVATMVPAGASTQLALTQPVTPAPTPVISAPNPVPAAPAAPIVTKALMPGHWQLTGWKYHWVPPDTTYRNVQTNPYIPGHFHYLGGAWIWVAGHYANAAN
jgi:hypothetical protein